MLNIVFLLVCLLLLLFSVLAKLLTGENYGGFVLRVLRMRLSSTNYRETSSYFGKA